jgi:hypothetical protein
LDRPVVVIACVVPPLTAPPLKSVSATYGLAAAPPQLIAITVLPPLDVVVLLEELLELDELELLLDELLLDELLLELLFVVPVPLAVMVSWADGAENPEALIAVTR